MVLNGKVVTFLVVSETRIIPFAYHKTCNSAPYS